MIYNYPYFGFPSYMKNTKKNNIFIPYSKNISYKTPIKPTQQSKVSIEATLEKTHIDHGSDFINILGLRLQFDDVLLISLILFLYLQESKDYYLLLALVLLLLE